MKHIALVASLLTATAFAAPAWAATVDYHASLNGVSEVPPENSKGTGTFEGSLDTGTKVLTYTLSYSGLSGPATAAHIHGPAPVGQNAGVMVPLKGASGVASPIKGTATLTDTQIQEMDSGQTYVNVHSRAHPAGEIRGQLSKGS